MSTCQNAVPLKPYLYRFFWIYSALFVTTAVVVATLSYFDISLYRGFSSGISVAISMTATLLISQQFAKKHQRFFNAAELRTMINGTTFLTTLFQVILASLYFGVMNFLLTQLQDPTEIAQNAELAKTVNVLHTPLWIWPILLAIVLVLAYMTQSFAFRFFAKRSIAKMNITPGNKT